MGLPAAPAGRKSGGLALRRAPCQLFRALENKATKQRLRSVRPRAPLLIILSPRDGATRAADKASSAGARPPLIGRRVPLKNARGSPARLINARAEARRNEQRGRPLCAACTREPRGRTARKMGCLGAIARPGPYTGLRARYGEKLSARVPRRRAIDPRAFVARPRALLAANRGAAVISGNSTCGRAASMRRQIQRMRHLPPPRLSPALFVRAISFSPRAVVIARRRGASGACVPPSNRDGRAPRLPLAARATEYLSDSRD